MDFNRITWIFIFLAGTGYISWLEWESNTFSFMGWFIYTSIWSAICGIAYTVADWLLKK